MKNIRKTFKYRLFPKKSQKTKLKTVLDQARRVYNETLATCKAAWEERQETLSLYDTNKLLTGWKQDKPELKQAHSQVLQNAQERVDLAFKAFFRRVKAGEKPGYPRFKSYLRYNSFTFKQSGFELLEAEGLQSHGTANELLRISKVGDVKIKLHQPLEGEVKTLTIQRDRLGNWYACFSCIVQPKPLPVSGKVVGIDLGLTTFASLSDGREIERQRWFKQDEKDLKRVQRKVSRLPKGSPQRRKAIKALNHIHQRIANRRKDFAHKQSRKLINEYQFIAFENLNINGMKEDTFKTITKGIADVAWNQFVQFTQAKAEEAARSVVLVDPKNTTQQCSGCGEIVPKDLSVRVL